MSKAYHKVLFNLKHIFLCKKYIALIVKYQLVKIEDTTLVYYV